MIKGKRLDLKPIDKGDVETLRVWRNRYGQNFFTSDTITKQQQRSWYQHYQDNYGRDFMYLIKLKDGTPIGTIALYNVEMADRTAEIGRLLLLEQFRSQGYMEEALSLLVEEAFERIRVWKLRLSCFLDNAGAISSYHKVGFQSLSRPVMIMEMKNPDTCPDKPLRLMESTYDEMSGGDYESTTSNVRVEE
jgi:RimJ/RimL family protein N-acetyltransferase